MMSAVRCRVTRTPLSRAEIQPPLNGFVTDMAQKPDISLGEELVIVRKRGIPWPSERKVIELETWYQFRSLNQILDNP